MATTPTSPVDLPAPRGPVPGWLGRALAVPYTAAVARRNRRFDHGTGIIHLDRPVISVGNLSVGGTGKTPAVTHLARVLLQAGHRPCIAMRGYGATPGQDSDEAAVYHRMLPEVPVVAQPDRAAGLIDLFSSPIGEEVGVVLLDDGFQHRRIARDLDLVLIDATRPPFDDRVLPAGWLREPVASLNRAKGVLITHAEAATPARIAGLTQQITQAGTRVIGISRHAWTGLTIFENKADRAEETSWLRGRRVFIACAIGNPDAFLHAAKQAAGPSLAGTLILRDHDPYHAGTIASLAQQLRATSAEVLLTTEKDWSKLGAHNWPMPVARPKLELRFDSGGEALKELVFQVCRAHAEAMEEPEAQPRSSADPR